jgi:hypothetical protein
MSRVAAGLGSSAVWCHISEAICLGRRIYCCGGHIEIRSGRLPGLIGKGN